MNFKDIGQLTFEEAYPQLYSNNSKQRNGSAKFDIILADLGFNLVQVDSLSGFSYHKENDELLDLRYNQKEGAPAHEVLSKAIYLQY